MGAANALPAAGVLTLGTTGGGAPGISGSGTLDLAGFNQTIAGLTVAGGATATSQIVGNSSTSTSAVLTLSGGTSTFGGVIQNTLGSGNQQVGLWVTGSASLTLAGPNTYTGASTINSGSLLQIGNGASGEQFSSATIADNGTLVFNHADALTYSGAVSGSGSLLKQGTGTLTLSSSNGYSGGTTISAGMFNFGNVAALGSGTATFAGNATLQAGASGTIANAIVLSPSVTGTLDTQAYNTTLSGLISGGGSLAKVGNGTLTLTNSNTYSGGTTLWAGMVTLDSTSALGTSTVTFAGNATLQAGEPGTIVNKMVISPSVTDTCDTQGNAVTLSGIISGSGGLTEIGSGMLTLTGSSNYSGATNVNSGTLALQGAGAINSFESSITINAGSVFDLNITGVGGSHINGQAPGVPAIGLAGNLTISGSGTWLITGGSGDVVGIGDAVGRTVNISMAAGSLINIQGGALVNGGAQAAHWPGNLASMNIAAGAAFDIWDGDT